MYVVKKIFNLNNLNFTFFPFALLWVQKHKEDANAWASYHFFFFYLGQNTKLLSDGKYN